MKLKVSILLILSLLYLAAQESNNIKTKGFSVPEYDDKGKLSSVIKGKTGTIVGKEALIQGVTVDLYTKDKPLILTTPNCKYKMSEKRCTSKDAVTILGDGVKITGVGFDIDNNSKKIFIRSQVKVVWNKKKIKKNESDKKTEK